MTTNKTSILHHIYHIYRNVNTTHAPLQLVLGYFWVCKFPGQRMAWGIKTQISCHPVWTPVHFKRE